MGLAEKILKKNKEKREKTASKLNGETYLYMGDPALQWGVGGWIRGRLNLAYGPRGSGKTALMLKACAAEQQKTNGYVIICDSEGSHGDPHEEIDGQYTQGALDAQERFTKAGLDWEKTLVVYSNRVDELFSFLPEASEELKKDPNYISAILVDSWGGVQSEQALEKIEKGRISDAGKSFGGNAKTIGPIISYLQDMAINNGVTVFFVQHCMQNQDPNSPVKWLLLGGQKLQFLCHNIIFLESAASKDSHLLEGDVQSESHADIVTNIKVGKKVYFRCEKSRRVVEGRKGAFWMNFENLEFALPESSLYNLAKNLGVFETKGAWVYYPKDSPSPMKWNGEKKVVEAFKQDKDLFNQILEKCMTMGKSGVTDGTGEGLQLGAEQGVASSRAQHED